MAEFKVDMHTLYIWVRKDPKRTWVKLHFIATDNEIYELLVAWPLKWHALDMATLERTTAQQIKKEIQMRLTELAERTRRGQKATSLQEATQEVLVDRSMEDQGMSSEQDMQKESKT